MAAARTTGRRVVAIVDDDVSVREAMAAFLESHGLATRSFGSAEQFLRSRLCQSAACLILDLRLEGMSGLELHRRLQDRGVGAPVIYCTGEADDDGRLRRRLLQAGARAVLCKPYPPDELLQLVQAALNLRSDS